MLGFALARPSRLLGVYSVKERLAPEGQPRPDGSLYGGRSGLPPCNTHKGIAYHSAQEDEREMNRLFISVSNCISPRG